MNQIVELIIAAYVAFRCIDAMTRSRSQFSSERAHKLTVAFAGITLTIAVIGGLVLLFGDVFRTPLKTPYYATITLNSVDESTTRVRPRALPIDPAETERSRAENRKLMEEYERLVKPKR